LKKNNYLLIAFSGEELGLLGSKYFTEHPTLKLNSVNYMINMDMVGRLNDSTRALVIGGYGTSPTWQELLNNNTDKSYFRVKFDSSGTGPSDYTSFYRKNIPVLFFFTGIHADYHKPTDHADKINYGGELQLVKWIFSMIETLDKENKLAFTKTNETPEIGEVRFSVSLGIMPDYSYNGNGVRVDEISDGRPAQLAGLKEGDIIVRLGDFQVSSLQSYMEALSKFKKGDSAKLQYKRGNNLTETAVKF
jgi:aminopeptidase YwaD